MATMSLNNLNPRRFKRFSFNPLHALIAILFAASYFAGNFHVAPVVTNVTQFTVPDSDCQTQNPKNSNNSTTQSPVSLDFESHHTAEDLILPSSAVTATVHIPPCDAKWFEYTPCEDDDRSLKFPRDRLEYREEGDRRWRKVDAGIEDEIETRLIRRSNQVDRSKMKPSDVQDVIIIQWKFRGPID